MKEGGGVEEYSEHRLRSTGLIENFYAKGYGHA